MAIIKNPTTIVKSTGQSTSKLPQIVDRTITSLTAQDLNGTTEVGENLLYDCDNLISVVLPDTVTSIESYAFNGATLQELTVTSSVLPTLAANFLGPYEFYEPEIITTIYAPDDADWGESEETWEELDQNGLVQWIQ